MPEETATAEAPVDELRAGLVETLRSELGDALVGSHIARGDLWVRVERSAWRRTAELARDLLDLDYFCFLSGLDWLRNRDFESRYEQVWDPEAADGADAGSEVPAEGTGDGTGDASADRAGAGDAAEASRWQTGYAGGDTRFQVFARLYSPRRRYGVTFKADLDDAEPRVDSWVPVYRGADWHEREAWEMFGFDFVGHPGLRHLYLPAGFEGHPLRKDFPLLARAVKPWPGLVDKEPLPGGGEDEEEGA